MLARPLCLCLALAAFLATGRPDATALAGDARFLSPPANISPPAIRGSAQVGWTLTALRGHWSRDTPLSFAYTWARCWGAQSCFKILGATTNRYSLGPADLGAGIKVLVTASNADGATTVQSLATAPVAPASPPTLHGTTVSSATEAESLTLARPVESRAGDVLVASLVLRVPGSAEIVPPQGWTLARRDMNAGVSAPLSQATYWRAVAPVEADTYRWTWSPQQPVEAAGGALLYRGAAPAAAIESATGRYTANTDSFAAPQVTTSMPNQLVLGLFGSSGMRGLTPVGMDELFDEAAIGANSAAELEGAASVESSPGPTGDRWVKDTEGTLNSSNIGQLVTVRPAAALTSGLPARLPASTGHTYYVSPAGLDENPGTFEAP